MCWNAILINPLIFSVVILNITVKEVMLIE